MNFTKYWLKLCWLRTISAACCCKGSSPALCVWDDLYQQEHRRSNCEVFLGLLCSCWGDTVQALASWNLCLLLDNIPVIFFRTPACPSARVYAASSSYPLATGSLSPGLSIGPVEQPPSSLCERGLFNLTVWLIASYYPQLAHPPHDSMNLLPVLKPSSPLLNMNLFWLGIHIVIGWPHHQP